MSVEIGQCLRKARENRGVSLAQVARETNIELKYLIAIEKGQFDLLPNLIYARAYVKSYAELVGRESGFSQTINRNSQSSQLNSNTQRIKKQTNLTNPKLKMNDKQYTDDPHYKKDQLKSLRPRSDLLDIEKEHKPITTKVMKEIVTETMRSKIVVPSDTDESSEQEERWEVDRTLSRRDTHQKNGEEGAFARWYTRVLIVGGVLLVIALAFFLYEMWTSPSGLPVNP